jgi:L-alanine-DL-glutamate epimerase-like enolase superfamily enzyme
MSRERDIEATAAVRAVIDKTRLRLDANEAWDPATALRMLTLLEPYGIEYVEQPTPSTALEALGQVTARSPIAIGADQAVLYLQRGICCHAALGCRHDRHWST